MLISSRSMSSFSLARLELVRHQEEGRDRARRQGQPISVTHVSPRKVCGWADPRWPRGVRSSLAACAGGRLSSYPYCSAPAPAVCCAVLPSKQHILNPPQPCALLDDRIACAPTFWANPSSMVSTRKAQLNGRSERFLCQRHTFNQRIPASPRTGERENAMIMWITLSYIRIGVFRAF